MTGHGPSEARRPLDGLKVLVVEDEAIVSLLIEDMLVELGCAAVWHASRLKEALEFLRHCCPDAVVLDVNLTGEMAYPIAVELEAAHVPFVFATGYGRGGIDGHWASRPVIQKPFERETLAAALASVVRR